jgi:hypothetical protein
MAFAGLFWPYSQPVINIIRNLVGDQGPVLAKFLHFFFKISKQKRKRSRQSSLASISQPGSHSSGGYNNNNDPKAFETASNKDDVSATYNFALMPAHSGNQQRLQNGSSMSLLGSPSVSAEVLALQNRLGVNFTNIL